jgi:aminopeptidase N
MPRFRLLTTVLAATTLAAVATGPAAAAPVPRGAPGAAGVGDRLFPTLGNGGYDAEAYTLDLTYRPDRLVDAVSTMRARATQGLTRFDLDFDGNTIAAVTLDGRPVPYARDGAELVVTPARPLRAGQRFAVTVTYRADPAGPHTCEAVPPLTGSAWIPAPDGFVTAGQPNCMHTLFPSNDHPSDKARYEIRVTAPADRTVVASGGLVRRVDHGGTRTWVYREDDPMPTALVQIAVGDYAVLARRGPHGTLLRDVVPTGSAGVIGPRLAGEAGQVAWMESRVGRYPFDEYGSLASEASFGFLLETQTLPLYPARVFTNPDRPESVNGPIQVHLLAAQWFGADVTPATWSDFWLSGGPATWFEAAYADDRGWASFEDRLRADYAAGDRFRAVDGPVAAPTSAQTLFGDNQNDGGALVLYALRERIGPAAFDRLLRTWLRTYSGRSATTADFLRLAGPENTAFLEAWLYGTTTPPMPNHPDWTVDPV